MALYTNFNVGLLESGVWIMYSATWGWILLRTGSLKMAILIHVLSNLFYAVVGFAGWDILA